MVFIKWRNVEFIRVFIVKKVAYIQCVPYEVRAQRPLFRAEDQQSFFLQLNVGEHVLCFSPKNPRFVGFAWPCLPDSVREQNLQKGWQAYD